MKKFFLPFAIVALTMVGCGESKEDSQTESVGESTKEEVSTEEGAGTSVEDDLIASIVHKGGAKSPDQIEIENMMANITADVSEDNQKVYGHWVGNFGKNMINITLSKIDGDYIEGYSVCAGNFRKITGSIADKGTDFMQIEMEEPGDNQYDGKFVMTADLNTGALSGHWTPFKKEGNSEKDFTLKKREYNYDPSIGVFPEGSQKVVTDDFLMDLDEYQLGYMRNEIYARHGYSFKNKEWRYEFEGQDWYMPMGVDIREILTDVEITNIGLIYEYESYYEDYYDEYGR